MSAPRRVVVGIGNGFRRDDGAGLEVAARLTGRVPAGVAVLSCEQEASRLLEAFENTSTALIVDAVLSGAEPGVLHRFDISDGPVPAKVFRSSTHAFGVAEAIDLARALGTLPAHVVVYGIEGTDFTAGQGLSAPVEAAVDGAVEAMLADLEEDPCTSTR
jgi:hydrogenase maturation protease